MNKIIVYIKNNWKDLLSNSIVISYGVCIFICTGLIIMYFVGLSQNNEWLSFWGSIIGGLLTLGGVWWTIKEQKQDLINQQIKQENQRREDLAIQYKPALEITELSTNVPDFGSYNTIHFILTNKENEVITKKIEENRQLCSFVFKLVNIGRGGLHDLTLSESHIYAPKVFDTYKYTNQYLTSIQKQQEFYLVLELPPIIYTNKDVQDLEMEIFLKFTATDEFSYNNFIITVTLKLDVTSEVYSVINDKVVASSPTYTTALLLTHMYMLDKKVIKDFD